MSNRKPEVKLEVFFYRTERGIEPVRVWIKSLETEVQKLIGQGFLEIQFTEHLEMPLCKKLTNELWELRVKNNNIKYRVIFHVYGNDKKGKLVLLLNGFIKKTPKTPKREIDLADKRLSQIIREMEQ